MAVGLKPLSEPEHPGWVLNAECELSPRWSYLVVQKHGQWQRLSSLLLDSFLEFCYKYDNQMVSKSSPKIRHLSFDMKTRRRFLCVEMLTCLATPTDYWILHFSLKKRGWQPRRLAICKDKGSGLTRTTHRANWFFFWLQILLFRQAFCISPQVSALLYWMLSWMRDYRKKLR